LKNIRIKAYVVVLLQRVDTTVGAFAAIFNNHPTLVDISVSQLRKLLILVLTYKEFGRCYFQFKFVLVLASYSFIYFNNQWAG
jgi:hypothetical protein